MTLAFLLILLISAVKGQSLPGLQMMQDTACVDSDLWLAKCTSDSVIAIEDIIAGAHVRSMNCPLTYRDANDTVVGECCIEKLGDCKFRVADIAFDFWHNSCSGRERCDTAGAQADVTNSTKCGNTYIGTYGNFSQYMSMYYYCIEKSKIQSICAAKSNITTKEVQFLQSHSYTNPRSGFTDCKCSVEVDQCDAKVEIYTVHLDLPRLNDDCGQQRLMITDGAVDRSLNCLNNTNKGILKMETNTSYITVRVHNSENVDAGRFWLAFRGCKSLPDIPNGTVSTDRGLSAGQKATYSCKHGYHVVGNITRTCLESGTWDGNEPTCQITKCQSLSNITDGMVLTDGDHLVGRNATYTCSNGFSLLGVATRICRDDGTWSGSEPSCSFNDCPRLADVLHGTVSTDEGFSVGDNATYTCDSGFNLTGYVIRTCLEDGSWSGTSPTCKIISCGFLEALEGGEIQYSNGTDYQSVATFRCRDGYSLKGSEKRECLANGSWSREDPFCEIINSDQVFPGRQRFRNPVCTDDVKYLAKCNQSNTVIAIENIVAGAKQAYLECPTLYKGSREKDCCNVSSEDCTFRVASIAYANWHGKCSGKPQCDTPGAQTDVTNKEKCGAYYKEDYGLYSQYMYMDYYCIDRYNMQGICSPLAKEIYTENMQFLTSDSYPDTLKSSHTNCSCSIEVDNCYSKINIYTIHIELGKNGVCGNQSLTITDGENVRDMSCNNKSVEGISVYRTQTTYVTVQLLNPEAVPEGKFWFGFGATYTNSIMRIHCPAETQNRCMNCPSLSGILNGEVFTDDVLSTGVKAYYNCSTGYSIGGDAIRTCLEDGTWSGIEPNCTIKDCGLLAIPNHGEIHYSRNTTYSSVAYYNCTEPYAVIGNSERTCEATGYWSGTNVTCEINECDSLNKPPNCDDMIYFRGIRDHIWVMYSCFAGYFLVGSETRECLTNKSWSGEEPACVIKDCFELKPPANGNVTFPNGTTYQSVAFIRCNDGFSLFGTKTRVCQEDGRWSSSETTCIFKQPLPKEDLERVFVCRGVMFDLLCPTGKKLIFQGVQDGTKLTTSCVSSECCNYSDTDCVLLNRDLSLQTACTGKQYCNEVMLPATDTDKCGNLFPSKNHYHSIEYYCVDRTKILPMCSSESVVMADTGRILYIYNREYPERILSSDTNCSCSIETMKCGSRINLYFIHFDLDGGGELCTGRKQVHIHDSGSTHILTCYNNSYYTIKKQMTSTNNYLDITLENESKINGGYVWIAFEATDNTAPLQINCPAASQLRCMDCPEPGNISNGMVLADEGFSAGKKITFKCDPTYDLVGDDERTCLDNGTWSGIKPNCIPKECPSLNSPEHGTIIIDGKRVVGQYAHYKCDEGYELNGDIRRECQLSDLNGTWSGNEPICKIVECENLTNPAHGQVMPKKTLQFMETATYSCDDGYRLTGNKTRNCQSDGSWNGMEPHCSEKTCPNLTKPENGDLLIESMTPGHVVVYSCLLGYVLEGNITRRCDSNYTWSGTDPVCTTIDGDTVTEAQKELGSIPNIAVLSGSGAFVLIAIGIALITCRKARLAAKAKHASSPRPPPSPPRPPNIPPNTPGYEIPHRQNRNENYTEQRSIVISDYHTISNSYIEVYDPTENRNENSDQTSDGNKTNSSQAEVNTSGIFPAGRSHSVTLQNNEENTTSGGENNNPLIPQLKRQSYEKPVQQSREKPIQLRSIWP